MGKLGESPSELSAEFFESRGVDTESTEFSVGTWLTALIPGGALSGLARKGATQGAAKAQGLLSKLFSRTGSRSAAKTPDHVLPIGPASEKAWTVLNRVDVKGAPLPGYKGGKVFQNSQGALPQTPGLTYREWDVNPYLKGVDRGTERLVTGSDGSAYFTSDHYNTFMLVRGPTG
jgi:guanyl-specific ribonuclease Sa